jgi:hypothetical protein
MNLYNKARLKPGEKVKIRRWLKQYIPYKFKLDVHRQLGIIVSVYTDDLSDIKLPTTMYENRLVKLMTIAKV